MLQRGFLIKQSVQYFHRCRWRFQVSDKIPVLWYQSKPTSGQQQAKSRRKNITSTQNSAKPTGNADELIDKMRADERGSREVFVKVRGKSRINLVYIRRT